jgi:hypothetical protein
MVDVSGRMEVEAEAEASSAAVLRPERASAHPSGLASATERK